MTASTKHDWLLFAFVVTTVASCGARSGLLVPTEAGPQDGSVIRGPDVAERDVFVEEPDAGEEADVATEPDVGEDAPGLPDGPDLCPDAGSTLIYLMSEGNVLLSFYPPTLTFTTIGTVQCNDPSGGTPYSMAVSRAGIAYVVFTSGHLYRVSTLTASCVPTPFNPVATLFPAPFGMGFSADGPDGGTDGGETLYVSGSTGFTSGAEGPSPLGWIDTSSFTLTRVGQLNPAVVWPELTGTGAGDLYGFWAPSSTSDTAIVRIDKATASDTPVAPLPGITLGAGWAFAFWGGDFYLFTAPDGMTTVVTRYRPSDGSITQVATAPQGIVISGAGVSTCAPQM